jgi:hypothetical protein
MRILLKSVGGTTAVATAHGRGQQSLLRRGACAPPNALSRREALELCHALDRDLTELVCKMLERVGIELGAGVIPRYGLMYLSAVLVRQNCGSVHAQRGREAHHGGDRQDREHECDRGGEFTCT